MPPYYNIPDVRDGLTPLERCILFHLNDLRKEFGARHIPVMLLYGRVVESLDVSKPELQSALENLTKRDSDRMRPRVR